VVETVNSAVLVGLIRATKYKNGEDFSLIKFHRLCNFFMEPSNYDDNALCKILDGTTGGIK
jgi:hypothetical protein